MLKSKLQSALKPVEKLVDIVDFKKTLRKIKVHEYVDEIVGFRGKRLGPNDAKALATTLAQNPEVMTLDVGINHIGDEGTIELAANITLTRLSVDKNNIGDESARALAANTTLAELDISENNIGDEGAKALAANSTLTELNVAGNNIDVEGFKALATSTTLIWLCPIYPEYPTNLEYSMYKRKSRSRSFPESIKQNMDALAAMLVQNRAAAGRYFNACRNGDMASIEALLTSKCVSPYARERDYFCSRRHTARPPYSSGVAIKPDSTGLHLAVQHQHAEVVAYFVQHHPRLLVLISGRRQTPLQLAEDEGFDKMVRLLKGEALESVIPRPQPKVAGVAVPAALPQPTPAEDARAAREAEAAKRETEVANVTEAAVQPPQTPQTLGTASTGYQIAHKDLKLTEKKLGSGGFGVVYLGSWQHVDVAIKQLHVTSLDASESQDLLTEAGVMAGLRHPHVVQLYGVVTERAPYCMVMEYLSGGSLDSVLYNKAHPLTQATQYRWGKEIGAGLAYLHTQKILHRDLKSPNVLLTEENKAKLTDFGLAKVKEKAASSSCAGKAKGTITHMAPELLSMGESVPYSTASDVYSLGIVLWELWAREAPFKQATNPMQVGFWVMSGNRPKLNDTTPPRIKDLIQRCWHQEASQRPKVDEVIDTISHEMGASTSATTSTTTSQTGLPSGPVYEEGAPAQSGPQYRSYQ